MICGEQEGGQVEVVADPYGKDPRRHPALIVRSARPFNAETPKQILGEQLHTPNELFFVRHHLPVPHIKPEDYLLEVKGEGYGPPFTCVCNLTSLDAIINFSISSRS